MRLTSTCGYCGLVAQTPEEKKLFELYGKLPAKKNVLSRMQKVIIEPSNSKI